MRRHGAILLALALVTAGCLNILRDRATAMELSNEADEAAEAWDDEAQLVAVIGLELNDTAIEEPDGEADGDDAEDENQTGDDDNATSDEEDNRTEEDDEDDPFDRLARYPDDELQDGQAPAWGYVYQAGNRTYAVAIGANGTVLAEETDEDDDPETPVEGWEVDSDEAAEIIAENNDTWANAGDDGGVWYALAQDEPEDDPEEDPEHDPMWIVGLSLPGEAPILYRVNATTGEYLGASTFTIPDFDVGGFGSSGAGTRGETVPEESGSFDGTLTATDATAEHTFEVDHPDHPELGVELSLDPPATGTVTATIEGPNGTLGTLEASPQDRAVEAWWEAPSPGEYTVTLELTQGVTQDYTLTWCAKGTGYEIPDTPYGPNQGSPCQSVDGERGPTAMQGLAPLAPS